MILIGKLQDAVVLMVTNDKDEVVSQTILTIEAANVVTKRIMDVVKDIKNERKTRSSSLL